MAGKKAKAAGAAGKRKPAGDGAAPAGSAIARVRTVAVKGGGAAEKRAYALLELIALRQARIAEDFYEIGEALRELQSNKLYLALGHASFGEMLRARRITGLSQAKKLIEVVAALPRDKAMALGPEKTYALTRYTAATPEVDTSAWLLDQGATVAGKSFEEISVRELTAEPGRCARRPQGRSGEPLRSRGRKRPPGRRRQRCAGVGPGERRWRHAARRAASGFASTSLWRRPRRTSASSERAT